MIKHVGVGGIPKRWNIAAVVPTMEQEAVKLKLESMSNITSTNNYAWRDSIDSNRPAHRKSTTSSAPCPIA